MSINELNTTPRSSRLASSMRFAAVTSVVLLLSACGSKQTRNPDALRVQGDLVALQADRNLATQSPISMQEAEKAVQIALVPERDKVLSAHRVYLADRKVQTARSLAQAQYAIENRKVLSQESNDIRLDARTREADAAKREADARTREAIAATNDANSARNEASSALNEASSARNEASSARNDASSARNEASSARDEASSAMNEASAAKSEAEARTMEAGNARTDAELARSQTEAAKSDADMARIDAEIAKNEANAAMNEATIAKGETNAALDAADAATRKNAALMAQLADLQAKTTERGIQLTLGDVLFSTGKADLKAGSAAKLDQLAKALASAPDRNILIEGFTDNVGSDASNMALSRNRANTVSNYLTSHGIPSARITANGKGEALPVAGNENPAGRQLNRRVEVTIENPSK